MRAPKQPEITEEYLRSSLVTRRNPHWTQGRWEPWLAECRPVWRSLHRFFTARGRTKEEAEQRVLEHALNTIIKEWAVRYED